MKGKRMIYSPKFSSPAININHPLKKHIRTAPSGPNEDTALFDISAIMAVVPMFMIWQLPMMTYMKHPIHPLYKPYCVGRPTIKR